MTTGPLTEVLARHTPELLAIPGVIGTGEGIEGGEPAFVVFVEANSPEITNRIPRRIEGYIVVIRVTGKVRALGK